MKLELKNADTIVLKPENIQDKVWLTIWAKEATQQGCKGFELQHNYKEGNRTSSGYTDPNEVDSFSNDGGHHDSGHFMRYEDIESLEFSPNHL